METEWVTARMQLYRLLKAHPRWTTEQLAQQVGYSVSWVKKWRRRFAESQEQSWTMFLSQSRAPKRRPRRVSGEARRAVLSCHEQLQETYARRIGPKLLLYHLPRDPKYASLLLPRSTRTLWQILKEAGRIPTPTRKTHEPLERPAPMVEWELDFGLSNWVDPQGFEFMAVIDRGTSLLVNTQATHHYQAESVLRAVAQLLLLNGLPARLRFDRDTRLVASWSTDGYPSALVRFLWCLGIEPVICPPRRPDLKPFVERVIKTLKHECLLVNRPAGLKQAETTLEEYRFFYNEKRPNQALSCGNRPPLEAFPTLPALSSLPEQVDPDRWLSHYHGRPFRRWITTNGTVQVDKYTYYLGTALAGQRVSFHLDAEQQFFHVLQRGQRVAQLPIQGLHHMTLTFDDYLKLMLEEARSTEQHLRARAIRYERG